jgi:hypothetical protein
MPRQSTQWLLASYSENNYGLRKVSPYGRYAADKPAFQHALEQRAAIVGPMDFGIWHVRTAGKWHREREPAAPCKPQAPRLVPIAPRANFKVFRRGLRSTRVRTLSPQARNVCSHFRCGPLFISSALDIRGVLANYG